MSFSPEHRASGLCVACNERAAPGRLRCEAHLAYHRERQAALRSQRLEAGLCARCDEPVLELPVAHAGEWRKLRLCQLHREQQALANRRRYAKTKAEALEETLALRAVRAFDAILLGGG